MAQSNHIQNVAIVGINGRVGGAFATELLKTGKHTITALTRADGDTKVPDGIKVAKVDYKNQDSLVAALKGQQFLIITMAVTAPPETHNNIVEAAVKAGVKYIMPNAYGSDVRNEALCNENLTGPQSIAHVKKIESLGMSYVILVCGHWYEWSLALGEPFFGIDIKNRTATFVDDGKTKVNISTWDQCGRAVAALLSLPESGASPALSDWVNAPLYISSFRISQRDMLDSVERVTGTTDSDWQIKHEPHKQRYEEGLATMKTGDRKGRARAMYTRGFFPNGDADYETSRGLANDALGLPKEDLDEMTKRAVEMVESGWNPFPG